MVDYETLRDWDESKAATFAEEDEDVTCCNVDLSEMLRTMNSILTEMPVLIQNHAIVSRDLAEINSKLDDINNRLDKMNYIGDKSVVNLGDGFEGVKLE